MVECLLSMQEVLGSIPRFSMFFCFVVLFEYVCMLVSEMQCTYICSITVYSKCRKWFVQ